MFEKDSPQDLLLRGFSREYILDKTGTDVGYHGNAMKKDLKGIDRVAYKIEFVKSNYTNDEIAAVLDEYALGIDAATVLDRLGLAGVNIIKLNVLFKGLGLSDEFKEADKAHRKGIMKQGMLDKYGVDNPFKLDEFQAIAAETRKETYGAVAAESNKSVIDYESVRSRSKQLLAGTYHKWMTKSFVDACNYIHGGRYFYDKTKYVKRNQKVIITCPEHGAFQQMPTGHLSGKGCLKCAPKKRAKTNAERYGVRNVMSLQSTLEKIKAATHKKYGVDYAMQDKDLASKNVEVKRQSGTFSTSSVEEHVKGFDNFEVQYNKDTRYPYLCDFYDKGRDLFIEVNASWTHGYHWYDTEKDAGVCTNWKDKSEDSTYYANALDVFTKRDVEKRETARVNSLNYVTLWDSDGMDADLWFAMGMPFGKDWEREYSWLPYHYIPEDVDVQNMHLSWSRLSAIVKDAQRKVFYKRELELWNTNPLRNGKWGTVQAFLYANRYKYLNKLPHELTDRMLLRAFRISGLHMGYTSFNSALMRQVIEKYNVKSVYDPCAGWGERMMTCGKLGVSYEGCDINSELFEGYKKLYELVDGFKPVLHNNDSANQLVVSDADAVITCPPYKNIEVYSDNGAENLSDEDFAAWWSDVVKNCSYSNVKVFAVQTNQTCRSVFIYALEEQGWMFKEELVFDNNQKSHFHRSAGRDKREYESMLVFTR